MHCLETSISKMLESLERDALNGDGDTRLRAGAIALLLKLTGVHPVSAPAIEHDDLPGASRRMEKCLHVLRGWARRGYICPPVVWGRDRAHVRWRARACDEAMILYRLLKRGVRDDELAHVMRHVLQVPTDSLADLARDENRIDKLFDSAAVGV